MDWLKYYEAVGESPNQLVVQGSKHAEGGISALDLGAGNFRDSLYLQRAGFRRILAVDPNSPDPPPGIILKRAKLEDLLPGMEQHDFTCCMHTLFFIEVKQVNRLLARVKASLKPGGILAFNVLGEKDDWAGTQSPSVFAGKELDDLKRFYSTVFFEEMEFDKSVLGSDTKKHWHCYNFVYKKP